MLHKIKLPFPPEKLASIFALQMQLLEIASKVKRIDEVTLTDHLKNGDLVNWLMTTYKRTVGPLNSYADKCPDVIKTQILNELRNDYEFWHKIGEPTFSFIFVADDPNRRLVTIWLQGYYDQFCRGIDEVVTKVEFLNKAKWLDAYKVANPEVRICPVCNGSLQKGIEIEHYFPQGKYPVLSVHASNMVPTCGDCNDYKQMKDPLDYGRFAELSFPYVHSVLDGVDVVVSQVDESYQFALVARDSQRVNSVIALSKLFGVPDRWNRRDSVKAIVDLAISKIEEKIDADRDGGKVTSSKKDFSDQLEALCNSIEKQKSKQAHFVPVGSWLRWAKDNISEQLYRKFCL